MEPLGKFDLYCLQWGIQGPTWKSVHTRSMCSARQQWTKEKMICTSKVIRFKMFACLSFLWAIGRPHKK